jgi:hypothetical protein
VPGRACRETVTEAFAVLTGAFAPREPSHWIARRSRPSLTRVMGWFLVGTLGVVAVCLLLAWLAWLTGGLSYLIRVIADSTRQIARTGNPPPAEQGPESS